MNSVGHITVLLILSVVVLFLHSQAAAQSREDYGSLVKQVDILLGDTEEVSHLPKENIPKIHGFLEGRVGYRLVKDAFEDDMLMGETRLQLQTSSRLSAIELNFKGDAIGDMVTEQGEFDLREGNIAFNLFGFSDVTVGRQILTWGTGDLVFINDLFPKDWRSFYIGRDEEYLNAPSDAAKLTLHGDWANLDVVYTPKFDPDRYPTGQRLSFYDPLFGGITGDPVISTDTPDRWFQDDEIAVRLYKNIDNCEYAIYAYRGFWKSPSGTILFEEVFFPDLSVYGASLRGDMVTGTGNVEFGYYQSDDNESGNDPLVNNSELRFLTGYTSELSEGYTASLQYYLEYMTDWSTYYANLPIELPLRDRTRHLITMRLTRLLLKQNLRLDMFTYFSPTDKDAYLRPSASYKINDNLTVECGANVFLGDYPNTAFGQLHNNTNIYSAIRYSF